MTMTPHRNSIGRDGSSPCSSSFSICSVVLLVVLLSPSCCHGFQAPLVSSMLPTTTTTSSSSGRASVMTCQKSPDDINDNSNIDNNNDINRRTFFASSSAALWGAATSSLLLPATQPAHAGGLIQFPCTNLKNRYHFLRAGTSELEVDHIYSTNPLFLTNRENALAVQGRALVLDACETLQKSGNLPTVAYHSLAANGIDTADLLGQTLHMGRDRILPEFTYLDQRGVGLWDSGDVRQVQPAVWALDKLEAGREGMGGRPPATEDGTPNETLADQFVRLRQFLSLQEGRTSGENILVIFADGTGPALLSAMIAGIALNDVHALQYEPGEVRLDISRESVLALYATKKNDAAYLSALEEGKEQLAAIRQQTNIVGLKAQNEEREQQAIDRVFLAQKEQERERDAAKERVKQLQLHAKLEQQQAKEQAKLQARKEQANQKQLQAKQTDAASATSKRSSSSNSESPSSIMAALGVGIAGAGILAAVGLAGGTGEDDSSTAPASTKPSGDGAPPLDVATNLVVGMNGTIAVTLPTTASAALLAPPLVVSSSSRKPVDKPNTSVRSPPPLLRPPQIVSKKDEEVARGEQDDDDEGSSTIKDEVNKVEAAQVVMDKGDGVEEEEASSIDIEAEMIKLEAAQDVMDAALMEDATAVAARKDPVELELDFLEQRQNAMNSYLDMDDGGSDWLQVLSEIRDEPEEEDNSTGDNDDDV